MEHEPRTGLTLAEIISAARWRWPVVVAIAFAALTGSTLIVESLPSTYEASATVAIELREGIQGASADLIRIGAPKYVAYLNAEANISRVARSMGVDPGTLIDATSARAVSDTGNIEIDVRATSPRFAASAANALADELVSRATTDPWLNARTIGEATIPTVAAWPPRRLIEVGSFIVGLAIGTLGAVLLERRWPRMWTVRDLERLDVPVLGNVHPPRLRRTDWVSERLLAARIVKSAGGPMKGHLVVTAADGPARDKAANTVAEAIGRVLNPRGAIVASGDVADGSAATPNDTLPELVVLGAHVTEGSDGDAWIERGDSIVVVVPRRTPVDTVRKTVELLSSGEAAVLGVAGYRLVEPRP